jgi:Fe-S-cluster containining protein
VADELQISVAEGAHASQNACVTTNKFIGLEIDIAGEPLSFRITLGADRLSLPDVVPIARTIATQTSKAATEAVCREGGHIACRPGCCACCHYLVPLSVPEALRLMQEVGSVPEFRQRSAQRLWLLTARRILRNKPPMELCSRDAKAAKDSNADLKAISRWYRSLKQACPFLREGLCTIYEIRPLACREYLVRGSYKACRDGHDSGQVVEIPVRATEVLGRLAAGLEETGIEAVMLPLVSVWHQANRSRAEQTWPAKEMVERFVTIVRQTAERNLAAPAST